MSNLETKKDTFFQENGSPRFWTLYYRHSNIPQITKGFRWDGSLESAIVRAREHCRVMNLMFICVRPMIVDLDYQEQVFIEKQQLGTEDSTGA